jgi:hypothetical protein
MFRFTIRDVLWLTVVVALAVGWWVDQRTYDRSLRRMDKQFEQIRVLQKRNMELESQKDYLKAKVEEYYGLPRSL